MVYCWNCGTKNPPGSFFCGNCGTKLSRDTKEEGIVEKTEEKILQQIPDARQYCGEKPKYKDLTTFGEQQLGNFILTDKRILFLRKTTMLKSLGKGAADLAGIAGFLAGLPQGLVLTDYIGGKLASAKVKPEEVEKILAQDPESLAIPLEDITQVKAKRAYMVTAYLMVKYTTPQGVKAQSFVFGTAAKSQKELANAIIAAQQRVPSK
ncbi:MAG: zinc ribbon domain-containing protein [Theionarchaea archaeon]|nr:MAG: hypothetical protein AYK18_09420 [Theionarchaea archaeon DG-70]MBU7012413.1 zinc ribbon domain-containing protein [Theionarchaea archaeon]